MGRVKMVSFNHFITDGVTTHYFPTDFDRKAAQFFLDKKAYLLYALAVEYPGLYKIPLCYREAAREALKQVGFKTSRPKYEYGDDGWHSIDYKAREAKSPPYALLFFLGPKEHRSSFGTAKRNATSFKIWFGKVGGLF